MKKRILSFLLVLCIIATLVIVPVSGSEIADSSVDVTELTEYCPCGCGLTLDQVAWEAYDPNAVGGVSSGHYYLAADYAQSAQYTVSPDARIVLDLRGYTLTTKAYSRLYLIHGYLAVLDTVGGGRMCAKTSGTGNGGVIIMTYSATDNDTTPELELYSGMLTVDADNKGALRGGLISVGEKASFRMYGGMVMNGCSQGTSARDGGCLAATTASSLIRIEGGTVIGGFAPGDGGNIYASGGTTILKNCRIIGGNATGNGGNIYQSGGSLTIENCVISAGAAEGEYGGGNICTLSNAAVTIRNTTIRNGYALKYGGNVYLASGKQLLENVTVTEGVAGSNGGNLRLTSKSVTTLDSCTVSGEVSAGGTLTLKGATKIGLNSNGLNLIYDGASKTVEASGLTEGAEIYVNANGVFTDAAAKADYFKPAIRTVITQTSNGLVATQAAAGAKGGYCPHCMEQVAWEPFASSGTLVASGHYYLTADRSVTSQLKIGNKTDSTVSAVEDVVLDLSGNAVTANYRTAYIYAGSTLSVLDSIGGGSVSGKGTSGAGGLIYNEYGSLNIFGGTFTYKTGADARSGGIIYSKGDTAITGGIFDAGAYSNTSYNGGVLYQSDSTKLAITAGYFVGGTVQYGGTVYIGNNADISITGGQLHGGTATTGGNIYVNGTTSYQNGSITISGAYIEGGHGTTSAGNIYIKYYKNILVEDTCILRGTTDGYGGNVVLGASPNGALYEDCLILWGSADRGGNMHSASESTDARIKNTTLVEGTAVGNGGNMAGIQGKVEFSGCSLICGKAGANGGNIYAAASTADAGMGITNGTKLLSGTAATGGNLFVYGPVEMDSAFVSCGKAAVGQDLYLDSGTELTKLTIGAGCTGDVRMAVAESRLEAGIYGTPVAGAFAEKLNMGITLEGDYGEPRLCAKDGSLTVAVAKVGDAWYANATEAAASCKADQFVKLFVDTTLELSGSCTIDLNGKSLTVTGSGTVCGMDSTGDGGVLPVGKAILAEGVTASEYTYAPDGRIYIAATENGKTTFHHLEMAITGAAIRPSVSGIYYTATWRYDAVLETKLETAGVAASAVRMPDQNFMAENSPCLWTTVDTSAMISGECRTGAMIAGILKSEEAGRTAQMNDLYGRTSVFATAYVTLASGTTIISQGANHSLYAIMKQLETLTDTDPNRYSRYLLPARDFYETWRDFGMGSWDLRKIPGKKDDGKLDILFIGNSFTYYGKCVLDKGQNALGLATRTNDQGYFYQVCKANGVEANVTNFTFGAHKLSDYYSHSCSADRGHDGLDHMAYLTDRDYDYVVLQQGADGKYIADILGECQPLMDVFREVNPDTKFVFLVHHMVHLDNRAYRSHIKDLEAAGIIVVDWGALVADVINGTTQVPGAKQTYNKNSFIIRKKEDDGYHENMLAGYITAQMTYCAITGESAVGQDYSFCGDTSVNKAFDFDKFLKEQYVYDPGNSNFIEIFNSESDMLGLQQLIDQYLAEKAYRNY